MEKIEEIFRATWLAALEGDEEASRVVGLLHNIRNAILRGANVIIVKVFHRASEAFYNYKLRAIWLWQEPGAYEDADDVDEFGVDTGAFNADYNHVAELLKELGFELIWEAY